MTQEALSNATPFQVLRRSCDLLTQGPDQPVLGTHAIAGGAQEVTAGEAVWVLRHGEQGCADAVWRRVIARVRAGESCWMVVAAGALLPRLVATCARFGQVPPARIADVEAEMLTALLDHLHTMDAQVTGVGSRLWYAAYKACARQRYQVHRDYRCLGGGQETEVCAARRVPSPQGAVSALERAMAAGVVGEVEAELIARTRLERQTLRQAAAQLDLSYITARRWRRAGELRLGCALGTDEFDPRVSAHTA